MSGRNALLTCVLVLLAAPATLAAQVVQAADDTPAQVRAELLRHFNESVGKVIALAEAVPADRYEWSPDGEAMSVARVYAHIARYNYYYPAASLGASTPAALRVDTLEAMRDKAQIVQLLKQSADHVRRVVSEMPAGQVGAPTRLYGRTVPRWAAMLQLVAHMNEHLGQSIAYARANNVVPPWSR